MTASSPHREAASFPCGPGGLWGDAGARSVRTSRSPSAFHPRVSIRPERFFHRGVAEGWLPAGVLPGRRALAQREAGFGPSEAQLLWKTKAGITPRSFSSMEESPSLVTSEVLLF